MKKVLFGFICYFIVTTCFSQEANIDQLKIDIEFLASDELKGREIGTDGEEKAAAFISERMKNIGLTPKGTEGYLQFFSVTPKANPHATEAVSIAKEITGMNVIGFQDNKAKFTVVIGAHFDHLGTGSEGSLHAAKNGEIHNGADDNASGVALLLQLAEQVSNSQKLKGYNYLFIAFSGEEKGLWGSNYFCKNPTIEAAKISYMLNFDMVGRLDESKGLAINGVGTSPIWKKKLESANVSNLELILGESGVGPSDHTSFYLINVPVLHFFTGQHADYHKPTDDSDKINYVGIATIHDLVFNLMMEVDQVDKLRFTKTKQDSSMSPRFTVTLGVMPDYLFQGDGMRIDGVTDGRPASVAGFEKGDIVIEMGEYKVDGMQSYMEALSKFKKGDKTIVKVKRGKKTVKKEVEF